VYSFHSGRIWVYVQFPEKVQCRSFGRANTYIPVRFASSSSVDVNANHRVTKCSSAQCLVKKHLPIHNIDTFQQYIPTRVTPSPSYSLIAFANSSGYLIGCVSTALLRRFAIFSLIDLRKIALLPLSIRSSSFIPPKNTAGEYS
jgi:hypothetical protein